jgi:hypothetical protein
LRISKVGTRRAASYKNGHVYVIDDGLTAGYFDGGAKQKP